MSQLHFLSTKGTKKSKKIIELKSVFLSFFDSSFGFVRAFRVFRGQKWFSLLTYFLFTSNTKGKKTMQDSILYKDESYLIAGAVFEVYREMGCGFLEAVYQECVAREFSKRAIPFVAQPELKIHYKKEPLQQTYIPDFICYDSIIVELKALAATTGQHQAQVLNYLKVTGMNLGLLINFGGYPKATIERIIS